tara:strand:- start:3779 stop:3940 length:162 start_codon:yes stop_codon:yes gene_type:complete
MREGTRALLFAVFLVVVAAALAWMLRDGGVFTATAVSSSVGKFGYDAMRGRDT